MISRPNTKKIMSPSLIRSVFIINFPRTLFPRRDLPATNQLSHVRKSLNSARHRDSFQCRSDSTSRAFGWAGFSVEFCSRAATRTPFPARTLKVSACFT